MTAMPGPVTRDIVSRGRATGARRNGHLIAAGLLLAVAVTAVGLRPKAFRADDQGAFQGTLTDNGVASTGIISHVGRQR
jgi:hypothetical protein